MKALEEYLIAYKKYHESLNPNHFVRVYGNFVECSCGLHAHYYKHGQMIEHDETYELNRIVNLEENRP